MTDHASGTDEELLHGGVANAGWFDANRDRIAEALG